MTTYRIQEDHDLFVVQEKSGKEEMQFTDQSIYIDEYWRSLAAFPSRDLAEGYRLAHERGIPIRRKCFLLKCSPPADAPCTRPTLTTSCKAPKATGS